MLLYGGNNVGLRAYLTAQNYTEGSQKNVLQSNPKLSLLLNGTDIEQVSETKLLGVTLDSHLSWSSHIDKLTKKMGRGLALIRRSAEYLTSASVVQVIQALVLSHLDYCPAVWSSASKKELRKLQIGQNKAARVALKCKYRSSIVLMHRKLSWLMVEQRLLLSLILFFRKICGSKEPDCLYNLIQYTCNRHTRQVAMERFTLPRPRTNAMKKSVMYRAMSQWNALPPAITNIESIYRLKKKLKVYLIIA